MEMDRESGKLEQIVFQFRSKILHLILNSRVPSLHQQHQLQSLSRVRKSDKWFNLVLGDRSAALENLNFSLRNLLDPLIIDIILVHHPSCSSSVDNLYTPSPAPTRPSNETVIERWVVQYDCTRVIATPTASNASSYKKTYKKSIILLRSLYAQMRLLPAYRIFRQLSSLSQTYNFDLVYKVSSFNHPFSREEEGAMKEYSFVPVEAFPGRLCVSVTYRTTVSDFNLEPLISLPSNIITDYVGSPTTDPIRSFPSSDKDFHATSFPRRGVQPPSSAPVQRPHSWSSGFHRGFPFTQNQSLAGSPPAYRASTKPYDAASPQSDMYGNRVQNRLPSLQQDTAYDEYQLSPPFSASASPSSPAYLSGANPVITHHRSETAPVTIPFQLTGRNSFYVSPNSDPSRHSLPPPSPRSSNSKYDASSLESPSGIRSYRKLEALRAGESPGLSINYSAQKIVRDNKYDSGRFSGLLSSSGSPRIGFSRSSSRLSFQDDTDDCEFSCPFDVDDVDICDSLASQNLEGKKAFEFSSQSHSVGKKSQDAAVGMLVQMLRTAPPLRQDSSCYSTNPSKATEYEGGVGTASGFFMPCKTADALEELKSYREMKDLLLSKSGTRVVRKEEM